MADTLLKVHDVKTGECMASIAQAHGFADYKKIYGDGANADLRLMRPNPNVLAVDDRVMIPEVENKAVPAVACATNEFSLTCAQTFLRIDVLDDLGMGLLDWTYELTVGNLKYRGTLERNGRIDKPIRASDKSGCLRLWPKGADGTDGYLIPLEIGFLEHESVDDACVARLTNLGFDTRLPGDIVGSKAQEETTESAWRAFQDKFPGPPDEDAMLPGHLDAPTRVQLRRQHEGS